MARTEQGSTNSCRTSSITLIPVRRHVRSVSISVMVAYTTQKTPLSRKCACRYSGT